MKSLLRAAAVALPLLAGTAVLAQDDVKKKFAKGAKEADTAAKDVVAKADKGKRVNLRVGWAKLDPPIEGKQRDDYDRVSLSYKAKIDKLEDELDELKEARTKALKALLTKPQLKQVEAFEAKQAKGRKKKHDDDEKDAAHDAKAKSTKHDEKDMDDKEDEKPKKTKKRIG